MAILGACHNKIGIVMQLRKNVKITSVHSAKKKGGEKIVYKYLFCPQCGGYRTREENGVEKVREALKTLKNMPKNVVEKLVACLDEEIYKDHKMEIEAKKALDRQIAGFAEKESQLIGRKSSPTT